MYNCPETNGCARLYCGITEFSVLGYFLNTPICKYCCIPQYSPSGENMLEFMLLGLRHLCVGGLKHDVLGNLITVCYLRFCKIKKLQFSENLVKILLFKLHQFL